MKKLLLYLGVMAMLSQSVLAFRPSGWVYINWPWAFESATGDWHWFKTDDTQWVNGFTAGGWRKMPESALATGWSFHGWPYAYCPSHGSWYYLNEVDTQWVVNMRTGAWSRFGKETAPAGMVLIPGGTNAGTDPDFGAYSLTVSSFYMDRYEVTKALWDEVRNWNGGNGYSYHNTTDAGGGKGLNHPVHTVSWYDCVKWCNARSQKEGRVPVYYTDAALAQVYKTGSVDAPYIKASANGYRVPTDAQWQYAARGGVPSHRFPWSDEDNIQHARANYFSESASLYDTSPTYNWHPGYNDGVNPYTSPVGSFAPNGYGLYDMAGNVAEWCFDWLPGPGGSYPAFWGGSWDERAGLCRVANRAFSVPGYGYSGLGFRAVLP